MARKKSGKKKKSKGKKSTLDVIRKITGPLDDERLGYLLWGTHFRTLVKDHIPVKRAVKVVGRPMSSDSRHFSDILHERINTPLPKHRERTSSVYVYANCLQFYSFQGHCIRATDTSESVIPPPPQSPTEVSLSHKLI